MSVVWMDGFDHYSDLTTNYDSNFQSVINTSGRARTGVGCLEIQANSFGPGKTIPIDTDCLIASSFWSTYGGIPSAPNRVYILGNQGGGIHYYQGSCVELWVNNDGSLSVAAGPSRGAFVWGTSAAGLFQFGAWNALALRATIGVSGSMRVWCNGVEVLTLTGIDNRNLNNLGAHYVDAISLLGAWGSFPSAYHDDFYALDCSDAVHNQYLGALRIYTGVPNADGAVQWTPSVGSSNFANVDSIPPNQATEYNSSGTSGQSDQYVYPLPGLPGSSQIFAVQHCQDVQVDSGSQLVTSDMAGIISANSVSPPNGWKFYNWPYDVNPATGNPWSLADFPLQAGPSIP